MMRAGDRHDPRASIFGGAKYLARLVEVGAGAHSGARSHLVRSGGLQRRLRSRRGRAGPRSARRQGRGPLGGSAQVPAAPVAGTVVYTDASADMHGAGSRCGMSRTCRRISTSWKLRATTSPQVGRRPLSFSGDARKNSRSSAPHSSAEHAGGELDAVVERRMLHDVENAAGRACARIRSPEHETTDTRVDHRPGAHRRRARASRTASCRAAGSSRAPARPPAARSSRRARSDRARVSAGSSLRR